MTRISVCIAAYNGEKYIKEQIESIITQLGDDDEIIVSDDQSEDNTLDIVRSFNDDRIHIVSHNKVRRPCGIDYSTHNFENALAYARGEYIFLSDQDDVWMPNKVSVMMSKLEEYDLVVADCVETDKDLNTICESRFKKMSSGKGIIKNIISNTYIGSSMAFRRWVWDGCKPFPETLVSHDVWLGLYSERKGKSVFIDDKLIKYRRHDSAVTPMSGKNNLTLWFKIKYRLETIRQLIIRW